MSTLAHAPSPAVDPVPLDGPRLLAGAPSRDPSLAGHLARHGPSPVDGRLARAVVRRGASDPLLVELERAGVTGRGGAGFPTARKVATVAAAASGLLGRRPVVVANVMEGEPASMKDRTLAVRAPHLILDGAQVLAHLVGAATVHVAVAADHDDAAASLARALAERDAAGTDGVATALHRPPGRYVTGEESALTAWLDHGASVPSYRPDRPSIVRVAGRPALVDNAETLAHVALVARYGADWYRSAGTAEAPGTTLVTVSGAVSRPGVREVALGTGLDAVLEDAGAPDEPAGVLLGGYGGSWIGPGALGTALTPRALATVGASLGAGVVVVLGPGSCGLAETARIARWMAGESAGQCGPCAFGLPAVADDLDDLVAGRAPAAALGRLTYRLAEVDGRGACRHPDFVVRLVRSALGVWSRDVERHVHRGPCPGTRATSVLTFPR